MKNKNYIRIEGDKNYRSRFRLNKRMNNNLKR